MNTSINNTAMTATDPADIIQVGVPASWGSLMALLLADDEKAPNENADMYMIRQFARLQFTSTTDLKAEYKRRFFEMCDEYITREDLIFKLIQRIHLEHYTPEKVLKDLKTDNPIDYARQVLQMATQGDKIKLPNGIILIREYKRHKHKIHCLPTCYMYKAKYYQSLTEIAQAITRTQCSGPMFFKRKTEIIISS